MKLLQVQLEVSRTLPRSRRHPGLPRKARKGYVAAPREAGGRVVARPREFAMPEAGIIGWFEGFIRVFNKEFNIVFVWRGVGSGEGAETHLASIRSSDKRTEEENRELHGEHGR